MYVIVLIFKINDKISLKLENKKTNIYVNNKLFLNCKAILINISGMEFSNLHDINSIDEAVEKLEKKRLNIKIPSHIEFLAHCSNIQAWYEHNYDTRLLHSNLGFPLLKVLVDAGDPDAKRVFKTEVADRFESGHPNAIISIIVARLLDYFNPEEKKQLLQHNFPAISIYIENASKHYPNLFPYIFEERLVDYVNQEQKTQLKDLNYPVI